MAKNRKATTQVLPVSVVSTLRDYLAEKPSDKPLLSGTWYKHAARMLRGDLAEAGVPYCVEGVHGKEICDFHALRHVFCSTLAASGAGAKELQTLARHSDPRLTLGLYTHAGSEALVAAVNRLHVPGSAPAASPLGHLNRDQLECVVYGMALMLGVMLGNAPLGNTPRGLLAPPLAPRVGISGDSGALLDTNAPTEKRES
ncbi:MAG: tyrosine-type recombinase/integrase [Gemmataceae bacterium]